MFKCNVCNSGFIKMSRLSKKQDEDIRDEWGKLPLEKKCEFVHEHKDRYGQELLTIRANRCVPDEQRGAYRDEEDIRASFRDRPDVRDYILQNAR